MNKRRMIEGWIEKASNQLHTAKEHLKSYTQYSESIEASQECIELSVKSILSLLDVEYPRSHGWSREEFTIIAKQIQKRQLLDRLAAQHAEECYRAASQLRYLSEDKLTAIVK